MQEESTHEERFWHLVSLRLSGEAVPEEEDELEELLRRYPQWGLRMQLLINIWNSRSEVGGSDGDQNKIIPELLNKHLQRLSNHLAMPVLQYEQPAPPEQVTAPAEPALSHHRIIRRWITIGAAASLLCLCTLGFLYILNRHPGPGGGYNTVSTKPGSRTKIQLPDGTEVWLNADSRMTYQVNGAGLNREVQLTGEAYFVVARDKDHPFLIHTPTIDVRVLGTTFDVRSYGNDKNTEASLFQGSVEVMLRNNPDQKIILQPNEKLVVHNNEMTIAGIRTRLKKEDDADEPLMTLQKVHFQQKDSSYMETLWMKNQLAFDNRTLEEVALQIERWYGVKVTVTDPQMKGSRFSGIFEDESLQQVMEALRLSGNFHYAIRKKEVIITP
jgi:transmembrane sensor